MSVVVTSSQRYYLSINFIHNKNDQSHLAVQYLSRPFWPHKPKQDSRYHFFYSRRAVAGRLPDPGLKEQVGVALETNAGLEEALERVALPVETVDDLSA